MAPNKTLAQLYGGFREFFPNQLVLEYFRFPYYDYSSRKASCAFFSYLYRVGRNRQRRHIEQIALIGDQGAAGAADCDYRCYRVQPLWV